MKVSFTHIHAHKKAQNILYLSLSGMFHEGGIQTRLGPAEGLLCTCDGSTIQLVSLFGGGAWGWERDEGKRGGGGGWRDEWSSPSSRQSQRSDPSPASHTCTYKSDTPALGSNAPTPPSSSPRTYNPGSVPPPPLFANQAIKDLRRADRRGKNAVVIAVCMVIRR